MAITYNITCGYCGEKGHNILKCLKRIKICKNCGITYNSKDKYVLCTDCSDKFAKDIAMCPENLDLKVHMNNLYKKYNLNYDERLVKYCIGLIDFDKDDFVLDAGSGLNKIWYNNIPTNFRDEIEIMDNGDFLEYDTKVDWVVGNPPYKQCWEFFQKAFEISNKGVGFLISINMFNKFTPKRLEWITKKGFSMRKLAVVSVKRWYGRYYFIIFTKINDILVFSRENYD